MEKVRMGKDIIIETNVIEPDGKIMDRWKVMKNDYPFCVKTIAKKHGIEMIIIDKTKEKKNTNHDLDWAI